MFLDMNSDCPMLENIHTLEQGSVSVDIDIDDGGDDAVAVLWSRLSIHRRGQLIARRTWPLQYSFSLHANRRSQVRFPLPSPFDWHSLDMTSHAPSDRTSARSALDSGADIRVRVHFRLVWYGPWSMQVFVFHLLPTWVMKLH
jgi:hypothetical protein